MADAMSQVQLLLRESIDDAIVNLVLGETDIAWDIIDQFRPMEPAGRDTNNALGSGDAGYFAEWRIRISRAGIATGSGFTGNTVEQMGVDNQLYTGQTADVLYPDPQKASLRNYLQLRMALKRVKGVLAINQSQINTDVFANGIESASAGLVEDAVALVRGLTTSHMHSDGGASLARFDGTGLTIVENPSAATGEFDIKEGTPFRFQVGQRYAAGSYVAPDDFDDTARTLRTGNGAGGATGIFRCIDIDTDNRKVLFESESGVGTITITDGDDIVLHDMFDFTAANVDAGSRAPQGFEGLLRSPANTSTAVFPGTSHQIAKHRYLKSYVKGDETVLEPPTAEVIAELVDKITDAGKSAPSALMAEQSLWTLYAQLERQSVASYQVPMGATFQASGGVSGPTLTHGTASFARLVSSQVRPGAITGVTPGEWRRFMPTGKTIRWRNAGGTVAGAPSIFRPVTQGTRLTELSAAEFDFFLQIGTTDPRASFRRIGLLSQRTMSAQ